MAEAAKEAQAATGAMEASEFDRLMTGAFKPKTDSAAEAIKQGVQTLAEQALATAAVVSDDATTAFTLEIQAAVDSLKTGKPHDYLSAKLARDALVLCHKECQSVKSGTAVAVS